MSAKETHAWPNPIRLAYEPEELSASQQHHPAVDTERLLESLGIDVERYLCPWARCLEAARQGKVDFLDHLYRTQARDAYLYFLQPSYTEQTGTFRFYAKPGHAVSVDGYAALKHHRIAVIRGNAYFPAFDADTDIEKVEATSESQMVQMVLRGRVDLFIAHPSLTASLINDLSKGQELIEQAWTARERQGVYFAIPRASLWYPWREKLESQIALALAKHEVPEPH